MAKTKAAQSDWQLYSRLLSYMWPYIGAFILSVLGFMLFAAMQVLLADILQFVVDAFGDNENTTAGLISGWMHEAINADAVGASEPVPASVLIPMAMAGIAFFRGIGYMIGNYFMAHVGRNTIHDLRCSLFDHMLKLPAAFYDSNTGGYLVSRITYNVEQVTGTVTKAGTVFIREGITVIFLLAYLFYVNWKLSLVFLMVAPFIALIVGVVSKRFRRISRRIQDSMGDVTHVTSEAVNGNRVMRIFGGERYERERFFAASEYNRRQSIKMAATAAASTPVIQFLVSLALCALVALGLQPDVKANLTPGEFVAFLTAAGLLAKPIRQLSGVMSMIQKGLAAAQDIFSQLDEPVELDEGEAELERVAGRVEFEAVSFSYRDDLPMVLRDINFSVEAGQTIALVGSSGSGKSSLVSLITRFYNLTEGRITIDGVDIREYPLVNLRQQIALVNQQVMLFNDTIFRNIAYGDLQHRDTEEIQEAARIAHAKEFIDDLPAGMDTIVGDNGVMLSGGQRQRIAIARAILKDAPILILDEATSALDNESERLIQDALEKVMENRTTFVIAHRLSTVENADIILVLEDGRIVESGSHHTLLERKGRYAQLHSNQFKD